MSEWNFASPKFRILHPDVKARHKCLYGGRGSGKSWAAAMMAVYIADIASARILFTREVQASISESMHKLVSDMIHRQGLDDRFDIGKTEISHKENGSQFIFRGMQDVKSMEGLDIVIVDEAQQVTKETATRLIPTVRREHSQLWWMWNPDDEDDWVQQYFLGKNPPPNTVIELVNYTDNVFCPSVLIQEAQYLRETNYAMYRHVWLGETRPRGVGWTFISPLWLDFAASGEVKPLEDHLMRRWSIGSDPAFMGKDDWVTITGLGNKAATMDCVPYADTVTIAESLAAKVKHFGLFNCDLGVDCVGTGIGVGDLLERQHNLGHCLQRLNRKDRDFTPPRPRGVEVPSIDSFDCWRSQAWWLLRCDLESGAIDLTALSKNEEEWHELCREILAHDCTKDNLGKIRITPKERLRNPGILGRSPGRADALVAWNWVRKRPEAEWTAGLDHLPISRPDDSYIAWVA
jgi:phage terminase large subunit